MVLSALTTMVRNFKHRKGRPARPMRCCPKRAGPGEMILMAMAIKKLKGTRMGLARRMQVMSSTRFQAGTWAPAIGPRKAWEATDGRQFMGEEVIIEGLELERV